MEKLHLLKKTAVLLCMGILTVMPVSANDIHVATNGDNSNEGTVEAPLLTIDKAMEIVQPGDRILVHEGTYMITKRIKIPALNTNPDLRCELRAWPEDAVGKVIIDGTNMNPSSEIEFKQSRCIYVNHEANYWTFYGLVLQNAKDNGMKVEGSYNIVERCTFRWNNDTGLQIGMFKDFSIEETKSFPISGKPTFNPNFSYCRYNKVINCDSYENADTKSYSGSDDGGDADGFAVKLFPGPGTEFHGCRAWTNSDDNWDLYMTYHPVVIDHCWAWHAGYLSNGSEGKNGNGFKLGGGGSAGCADFDHSVGAHVLTNCVAFENLHKGFDQNNAYEGMYIFNCVAWDNEYNYRFPTEFKYGAMDIHNCIGWGATAEKSGRKIGNLNAESVLALLKQRSIEIKDVRHAPRTSYELIIYIHARGLANVTKVYGIKSLRLLLNLEHGLIYSCAHRNACCIREIFPRPWAVEGKSAVNLRCLFGEGESPLVSKLYVRTEHLSNRA